MEQFGWLIVIWLDIKRVFKCICVLFQVVVHWLLAGILLEFDNDFSFSKFLISVAKIDPLHKLYFEFEY